MKILIATHHFPPRYTSGGEWQAFRTASALQARGHTVKVVCVEQISKGSAPAGQLLWQDDFYEDVAVRRLTFDLSSTPDMQVWEYDNTWIGDHLHKLIFELQPDLFHLIGGYLITGRAIRTAHAANVPVVVTLLDFWFLCRRLSLLQSDGRLSQLPLDPVRCARCLGEEQRRYAWLGKIAPSLAQLFWQNNPQAIDAVEARLKFSLESLNLASIIISPSRFLKSVYDQAGANPNKTTFMRFGLDVAKTSLSTFVKKESPGLRVGYLGQIAHLKGVHILTATLKHIPQPGIKVSIYGDTERFPKYVRQLMADVAGDARLEFAGAYKGHSELTRVLQQVDVIVVPSIWYENSPTVILEAFLHGVPVLVSKLGGMAELVEDGVDGLHFAPGSAEDLARCLKRLMNEPELLPRLRAGIRPVKTLAQEMDELEAVYGQVVGVPA